MKNYDLTKLVPKIVVRLNHMSGPSRSSIHLSISSKVSRFSWKDRSLEAVIRELLAGARSICDRRSRIQV